VLQRTPSKQQDNNTADKQILKQCASANENDADSTNENLGMTDWVVRSGEPIALLQLLCKGGSLLQ
jgi:hypothetical protein